MVLNESLKYVFHLYLKYIGVNKLMIICNIRLGLRNYYEVEGLILIAIGRQST